MQAGQELDALVAEKVMQCEVMPETSYRKVGIRAPTVSHEVSTWFPLPPYSTDMTAAWEVVEKFDYCYLFYWKDKFEWECKLSVNGRPQYYGRGSTAPVAICKAALAICGVTV